MSDHENVILHHLSGMPGEFNRIFCLCSAHSGIYTEYVKSSNYYEHYVQLKISCLDSHEFKNLEA